ncbi:MAG: glycosyltransferase [Sulfitobacter sp.]
MKRAPRATAAPHISVIIPIYNVAAYVAACVQSVQGQTWTDFEVLMIDDGSTDGSGDIAQGIIQDDPRFRLIRQGNAGLGAARNAGLDVARGETIAFVDADDRIMPDFLMRLWQVMQDTNADWVACALQNSEPFGSGSTHSAIHGRPRLDQHLTPRRYALNDWCDVIVHFPSAWNKLYRRNLVKGLRFDTGTWFEDHSFFHRAAARTDHIVHLPEALYIQTRGRPGQITAQDDDRIFEQFEVLEGMAEQFKRSTRSGGTEALARITSRLLFERSTVLVDPTRRARFAQAAQAFMTRHSLSYTATWDPGISLIWGMEMEGHLPLSVILNWDGTDTQSLWTSLESLWGQQAPSHDVHIVCQTKASQRRFAQTVPDMPPHWQVSVSPRNDAGAAFNHGLAQAQGAYVIFLQTGDALPPHTLTQRVEAMLHADADFGISQMRLHDVDSGAATYHNGIIDMDLWPHSTPPAGPLTLTAPQALSLEAQCSAKTFRRSFLQAHAIRFSEGPRGDWALTLGAALLAPCITYIPVEGAIVPLRNEGFVRWHTPLGGRALARGHSGLIATLNKTLPADRAVDLPKGWQRKLFARALREQVYFGSYGTNKRGRTKRSAMMAHAALAAWQRGYGTHTAAGLDPFIGPRMAKLLDPVSVVLGRMGRPGRALLHSRPIAALSLTATPKHLHAFDLGTHGTLTLRADLRTSPYANIYFHAAEHDRVLFHLSLRRDESFAACNSQRSNGDWQTEQTCPVDLPTDMVVATLIFTATRICVDIQGKTAFDFDRRRTTFFTAIDTIAGFALEGQIRTPEIVPQVPDTQLTLDSRLALHIRDAGSNSSLTVEPAHSALAFVHATNGIAATAQLPARLWRDLPHGASLKLNLSRNGRHTDTLTITRDDFVARIEALLCLPLATTDSTLCLTVLEYVSHAKLQNHFSPKARAHLDQLAMLFGTQSMLEDQQTTDMLAPPPPSRDPVTDALAGVVARLAESQSVPAAQRPDPLTIVAGMQVAPQARQLMFLNLSEFFCTGTQDFAGLYALAKERDALPLGHSDNHWMRSAALPFLVADRQFQRAADDLYFLANPGPDWLVTPAIAWAARTGITGADTPAPVRRALFYGFCDLVYKRAYDYWDRAHCRELTRTAAHLILNRHRLEPFQQTDAINMCLAVYGLSRQFWSDLADATDLPAEIQRARAAFADIIRDDTDAQRRDVALRLFETLGTVDAPRMRRELFGPAGLPVRGKSHISSGDLAALHTPDTRTLGESVLRHMAHPGSQPVTPRVAKLASATLPTLYPQTPRAPYFDVQQTAAQQAMALLAEPARDLAALTDTLAQLADVASHHLGLGMALSLIDGLGAQNPDHTETLCDWVHAQIPMHDHGTLRTAPALHQPLRRLSQRADLPEVVATLILALDIPMAPASALDNDGLPDGHPLFDTIVTVFSCVPYLETRIDPMRKGWLSLLKDLGVPYVIVVGDGDGTRRGDVVHLDAPDDYEGLPQKTLATIRWVHDNTLFGHMLKIDDDCFLDAPLFFQSQSYRKFDYYGRYLYRGVGQMDRQWHQSKSSSARGKLDLDKSPEPSEYTDGGTGYALSRTAMAAALDASDSPEGQHLVSISFMEDKMLGDLLAMRAIRPVEEDYRISIRRRTYGAATPVALWHNSFHPSATAPLQLVHLDTHLDQADALERRTKQGLWPRKIWPSYQRPQLGYQSNALELISSEQSVARASEADVAVVACMRNEMFMLPQFLAHYRKLGVRAFLIADNCSDDGTLEYLADQPDVALFSVDTDYNLSRYGVAWQQAMMAAFRVGKWSLVADADELLVWQEKQTQTLPDLLKSSAFETADAARIFMLDMYPQGPLEDADFISGTPFEQAQFADQVPFLRKTLSRGPFSDQPSWTSALRHRLITGSPANLFVAQKLALLRYRPWMRLSAGLHYVGDVNIASRELLFAHFKYNADFRRKAQAEVLRGQHFNDAEEYRKYLALVSEGRSVIYDPNLSAPWTDVPFVRDVLSDKTSV